MIPLFTAILGLIVALVIFRLVRRDQLEALSGIAWISVAAGFCFLGFAPTAFDTLAGRLGVAHPPSLAFSIALGLITLKLVYDDVQRSQTNLRLKRTVQRLAMLEADAEQLRSRHQAVNAKDLDTPEESSDN